jgi:hypothetical protein
MISGTMKPLNQSRAAVVFSTLTLVCGGTSPAYGQSFTLESLAALLSGVEHSEAAFVETKTMAMLDQPLHLEGKLYFRAPDYVRKEVILPEYENYEIAGDMVHVQTSAGVSRTMSLDRHPALRGFAEAFRATLRGDMQELQRFYVLQLFGVDEDWQLHLTPTDPSMAAHVERIEVSGGGAQLSSILILDADGDQSRMQIQSIVEQ